MTKLESVAAQEGAGGGWKGGGGLGHRGGCIQSLSTIAHPLPGTWDHLGLKDTFL